MKALIVEDRPEAAEFFAKRLIPYVQGLDIVDNIEDAMTRLREDEFTIVLLDLTLKTTNARETLNYIPSMHEIAPQAAIVVITGALSGEEGMMTAIRSGADSFMEKPAMGESFMDEVCRGLEQCKRRNPVEKAGMYNDLLETVARKRGLI